jgi:hypothetical protein
MSKRPANTTSFKKGRAKTGGRKAGTPNKRTKELNEAVVEAMERTGYDGNGLEGMVGYLRHLAENHPGSFASLVSRLLPLKMAAAVDVKLQSHEQILRQLRLRKIPIDHIFDPAPIPVLDLEAEEIEEPINAKNSTPKPD